MRCHACDEWWNPVRAGSRDEDGNGRIVALIHEDSPALRRMVVVFDDRSRNAVRKGDHILAMGGGQRSGDHGLTFHSDRKLRTVLWGWIGEAWSAEEI